jgi:ADP-ribosylglycohydrolase
MTKMPKDRAHDAVVGGFVGDAACMGMHWVYDTVKLEELLKNDEKTESPEFFSPPSCPYYTLEQGEQSPWGAEALELLRYLGTNDDFDGPSYSKFSFESIQAYKGRLNGCFKVFRDNYEKGNEWQDCGDPEDTQAHSMIKVPTLVARYYALEPAAFVEKVTSFFLMHQSHPMAKDFGVASALILKRIVNDGDSIADAVKWTQASELVADQVKEALQKVDKKLQESTPPPTLTAVAADWGQSCGNPHVFMVSVYCMLTTSTYAQALRLNIRAGGDNCSRGTMIGACMAAASTAQDPVPEEWKSQTNDMAEVNDMFDKLSAKAKE